MAYKGLRTKQRERILLALREDTLIQGTGNVPAGPDRVGKPSDGNTVKWWVDMSFSGSHFHAQTSTITYNESEKGIDFAETDNDWMTPWPNLSHRYLSYWRPIHEGSFSFSCRFTFDGTVGSGDDQEIIFATQNGGGAGVLVSLKNTGSGTFLKAELRNGSGSIWDTENSPDTSIDLSGKNELYIEQDAAGSTNSVSVNFNGSEIFSSSGFSLPSGVDPEFHAEIGNSSSSADMILQGIFIDPIPGNGASGITWIRGNELNPRLLHGDFDSTATADLKTPISLSPTLNAFSELSNEDFHGMTEAQRDRMLFALREDTMFTNGQRGLPTDPSNYQTPGDGIEVQVWGDIGNSFTWQSTGGDTILYDGTSPSGLDLQKSNGHETIAIEQNNLSGVENDYYGKLIHEDYSLAMRCHLKSLGTSENSAIMAAGGRTDNNVFYLGYQGDGGGGTELRIIVREGGTDIINASPSITPNGSSHDEIYIEQDATSGTFDVNFNGSNVLSQTGLTYPSGPVVTDQPLSMGVVFNIGSGQEDFADIIVSGTACDVGQTSNGSNLISWIKNSQYQP